VTTIKTFIQRHSVIAYFTLVLVISWGGFLLVGWRGLFTGTSWQTDPRFQAAVLAMLAGPPVAGILMTAFVSGMHGLRELFSRLLRWRVGVRWYAAAILIAPLLTMGVLFTLALVSPVFLPSIVTTQAKAALLLSGVMVGLVGGFMEELGWTGFAIPQLRVKYGVLAVGAIVGVVWGVWHLLQMWWVGGTSSEALSLTLFMSLHVLFAIAQLTAYRVLMVWVYDHAESLLVAVLMHASYIFSTLFVLAPPTTGIPFLIFSGVFTVALWCAVAAVMLVNGGNLSSQPHPSGVSVPSG
jgi:membrane protease YdiL (CAAX protease family)